VVGSLLAVEILAPARELSGTRDPVFRGSGWGMEKGRRPAPFSTGPGCPALRAPGRSREGSFQALGT